MKRELWKPILVTVTIYLIFGVLWIALTDPILHTLIPDPRQFLRFEIYKGWLYILITSGLLTLVLYRQFKARFKVLSDLESAHEHLRLAYRELETGEERFRATFEQTAVGVAFTNEENQLLLFNQKWSEMLNVPQRELLHQNWTTYLDESGQSEYRNSKQSIHTGESSSASLQLQVFPPDLEPVWVKLVHTYVPSVENGSPYWILVINDINRLVVAEQELRKLNDELESRVQQRTMQLINANRELENFAYSVSHDLRAPLRGIIGYASILLEDYSKELGPDGSSMLQQVNNSSLRMNELIDDLLRIARLGKNTLVLKRIRLADVVKEMLEEYGKEMDERKARVILPAGDSLGEVYGDPTLLHQVFCNLLDNALKYQKAGSHPVIKIETELAGDNRIIRFCDNGIGIPSDQYTRIFDIFQRGTSSEGYSGTGIGLAIVKKAVELMSGQIMVDSVVGQGACFILQFKTVSQNTPTD